MSEVSRRSKVDWWIFALLGALLFGPVTSSVDPLRMVLFQVVILVVFLLIVAVPMRYTLSDQELIIRSGLLTKRIPYSHIKSVCPRWSPWNSWALSADRLELSLNDGDRLMISPVHKDTFAAELRQRIAALQAA